jgi:hypothetical protein
MVAKARELRSQHNLVLEKYSVFVKTEPAFGLHKRVTIASTQSLTPKAINCQASLAI